MGLLLDKQFKKGDPTAGVPHRFYNDVDEILSRMEVYNGHIERNGTFWTIVIDQLSPDYFNAILFDGVSINSNSSGKLQVNDFATASNTAPASDDLFTYKDISGTAEIKWCTSKSIVDSVSDWSGASGNWWIQGQNYTKCYGSSIGSDASTIRIDLANKQLEGEGWSANTGTVITHFANEDVANGYGLWAEYNGGTDLTTFDSWVGGVIANGCAARHTSNNFAVAICDETNSHAINTGSGDIACGSVYTDAKVVGTQESAIASFGTTSGTDDDGDAKSKINDILTALRNHGLIAT